MNIKSPEAHLLAREVAALTGESLTEAVTVALRERLERLIPEQGDDRQARFDEVLAIVRRTSAFADQIPASTEIDGLLYDEDGLPR
jgi:antitoxin VapB